MAAFSSFWSGLGALLVAFLRDPQTQSALRTMFKVAGALLIAKMHGNLEALETVVGGLAIGGGHVMSIVAHGAPPKSAA